MLNLWEQLQKVKVIHARGTPTSGKSMLAQLLYEHVKKNHPDREVFEFSWPGHPPSGINTASKYVRLLNSILGTNMDFSRWKARSKIVLIIDEAQLSYEYDSLWVDFLKPIASDPALEGPLIMLFTSYGSPSQVPFDTPFGTTPVHFTAEQRVSIRPRFNNNFHVSLYFTRAEFDDVISRVGKYHSKDGQLFALSSDLSNYIWEITHGHPCGTRVILDILAHSLVGWAI